MWWPTWPRCFSRSPSAPRSRNRMGSSASSLVIDGRRLKKIKEPKAGQPPFLVQDFPEVRRGCKLLRIESQGSAEGGDAVVEGEAVLMSFQDAVPLITAGRSEEQPLVLTFAPPVDDDEGGPEPSPYQR